METDERVAETKRILEENKFIPIESPLKKLFDSFKNRNIKSKQRKIEGLKLDIEIAKLEKELGKI